MTEGVDLSAVLARNARALRGSATLDDVAKAASHYGLNWNVGRVSDLERGRVSPRLDTLIALALALAEVRGEYLTLGDLVKSDENVALTKDLTVTSDELQGFLAGGDVSLDKRYIAEGIKAALATLKAREDWPPRLNPLRRAKHDLFEEVWRDYGEPEQLLARDLDLDRDRLTAEMTTLWGQSYHAERDKRAGPGANAQKKGRIARTLKAELKAVLDGDHR